MRIAICDDEVVELEGLKADVASVLAGECEIDLFSQPDDLLAMLAVDRNAYDIIFLDIIMQNSNGWELAAKLKSYYPSLKVVLVSYCSDRYVYNSYDRADWVLEKPVDPALLKAMFAHFKKERDRESRMVSFPTEPVLSVYLKDIIYIEAEKNYQTVHTVQKNYRLRLSLKQIISILERYPEMVQIHHSYVINLQHYRALDQGRTIMMAHGDGLKLSRTYREHFFQALLEYTKNL